MARGFRDENGEPDTARAWEWLVRVCPDIQREMEQRPEPVFKSAAIFEGKRVPPKRWHVREVIPAANATLFAGDGGVGKSLLAMQLAVATAAGLNWIGLEVCEPGPVIYLSAEDDEDELHRRFADILTGCGLTFADVPNLYFRSMVGQGALLAERTREQMKPSGLAVEIEAFAAKIGAKLIVLDTLANLYPGDESDRAQVTQFVDIIKGIGLHCDSAMLLLAHPSKSAMETGEGYSGSTAWHGAVRSRLYMRRITTRASLSGSSAIRSARLPAATPSMSKLPSGSQYAPRATPGTSTRHALAGTPSAFVSQIRSPRR